MGAAGDGPGRRSCGAVDGQQPAAAQCGLAAARSADRRARRAGPGRVRRHRPFRQTPAATQPRLPATADPPTQEPTGSGRPRRRADATRCRGSDGCPPVPAPSGAQEVQELLSGRRTVADRVAQRRCDGIGERHDGSGVTALPQRSQTGVDGLSGSAPQTGHTRASQHAASPSAGPLGSSKRPDGAASGSAEELMGSVLPSVDGC